MDGLNKSIYEIGSDSAFSIMARSNQLIKEGKDVINLGIGQPDFPTPKNIVESIEKELNWGAEKLRDDITCMAINIENTELIKKTK